MVLDRIEFSSGKRRGRSILEVPVLDGIGIGIDCVIASSQDSNALRITARQQPLVLLVSSIVRYHRLAAMEDGLQAKVSRIAPRHMHEPQPTHNTRSPIKQPNPHASMFQTPTTLHKHVHDYTQTIIIPMDECYPIRPPNLPNHPIPTPTPPSWWPLPSADTHDSTVSNSRHSLLRATV